MSTFYYYYYYCSDSACCVCRQMADVEREGDIAMQTSPCGFIRRRQLLSASPLSPTINHGCTATSKRRRVRQRTGKTGCVADTWSPCINDSAPVSSDVCRALPSATVMVDEGVDDDNSRLIGDFSRPCSLPVLDGKHADLPSISPDTVPYHSSIVPFLLHML